MKHTDVRLLNDARLRRGDTVRVRPAAEILKTLDERGDTENLPFMPEMVSLCGATFQVSARADKTCDTVNLTGTTREMSRTVHLVGARCNGSAHGGCQAGCLLFFKESWLERIDNDGTDSASVEDSGSPNVSLGVKSPDVAALEALVESKTTTAPGVYRCQATAIPEATRPMVGMGHYIRDLTTRNVPPRRMLRALAYVVFNRYQRFSQRRLPNWARFRGGVELPDIRGTLIKTPTETLDLQPGELVEIKSLPEIMATLNVNNQNRGLWFDREMIQYCGKRFRVQRRVNRIIDEKTGKIIKMKNPCIILDGTICLGDYHKLCPRLGNTYWREIWLKRVEPVRAVDPSYGLSLGVRSRVS
jgi:hypothetical protein